MQYSNFPMTGFQSSHGQGAGGRPGRHQDVRQDDSGAFGRSQEGWQHGGQETVGREVRSPGSRDGIPDQSGGDGTQVISATYDDAAINELLFMIEEEKLAGDIYDAFYDMYGLKIFDNIAASEDRHFDALVNQAEKIGVDTDQFVFGAEGSFVDEDLQEMYDTLLAQGSASVTDALEVGLAIEEKDIVDIAAAAEAVEGTKLAGVYDSLLTGSSHHLDAFEGLLGL